MSIKTCIATRIGCGVSQSTNCCTSTYSFCVCKSGQLIHHTCTVTTSPDQPSRRVTVLGKRHSQITFKVKTPGVVERKPAVRRERNPPADYVTSLPAKANHHSTPLQRQMYSISRVIRSSFKSILHSFSTSFRGKRSTRLRRTSRNFFCKHLSLTARSSLLVCIHLHLLWIVKSA